MRGKFQAWPLCFSQMQTNKTALFVLTPWVPIPTGFPEPTLSVGPAGVLEKMDLGRISP